MQAVLGIGNPGKVYENTKHNVGFIILDRLAEKHNLIFQPSNSDYFEAGGKLNTAPFLLIKPTTYVNNSGLAAVHALNKYKLNFEDLLVVADDVNLDLGKIRIRQRGGDGGHNGLHSLIYHLNSDQFPRLRFGIGKDFEEGEMADYVLSRFDESSFDFLENRFTFALDLIEAFLTGGLKNMLDHFSKKSQKNNEGN